MNSILEPLFQMLTKEEKQYAYILQDNETTHTSLCSVEAICEMFGERIISQGLWPPPSPGFSYAIFTCGETGSKLKIKFSVKTFSVSCTKGRNEHMERMKCNRMLKYSILKQIVE
jgi:hypothetical protein